MKGSETLTYEDIWAPNSLTLYRQGVWNAQNIEPMVVEMLSSCRMEPKQGTLCTLSRGSVLNNIFSVEIQTFYALKTVTSIPFFPF